MKARGFKRAGLHRFECSCGNYTYCTVAAVERYGLPVCPCGETFKPGRVELAFLLGVEDCPVMDEYRAQLSSIAHGRSATGLGLHAKPLEERKSREARMTAEELAAERLEKERRSRARSNRLGALVPVAEPIPF